MVLDLQKKKRIIDRVSEIVGQALSAVVASLEGVSANDITQLRQQLRNCGVYVYVIRNTLLRRIVDQTSFECLKDVFVGQSVIAFSMKQPSDAARIFLKFTQKNEFFTIKGAAFENKFITASQIDFLSKLPTYEEAISRLIITMKKSSVGNLIYVLRMLLMNKKTRLD